MSEMIEKYENSNYHANIDFNLDYNGKRRSFLLQL